MAAAERPQHYVLVYACFKMSNAEQNLSLSTTSKILQHSYFPPLKVLVQWKSTDLMFWISFRTLLLSSFRRRWATTVRRHRKKTITCISYEKYKWWTTEVLVKLSQVMFLNEMLQQQRHWVFIHDPTVHSHIFFVMSGVLFFPSYPRYRHML